MPWARFDDGYPSHRKVRPLSDAAFRLDVSAVCWSAAQLTDGRILPDELALVSDVRRPERVVAELVNRGRWHAGVGCGTETCPVGGVEGWQIHDYLDQNPSRAEILTRRATDRQRKRRGGGLDSGPPPAGFQPGSERSPGGVQTTPRARPRDAPAGSTRAPAARPVPTPSSGDVTTDVALVDARDSAHSVAGVITALYAAGVPLTDHGRAHRSIAAALDSGVAPDLVRRGVGRLIAEQRACTLDTLRIAIYADDAGAPQGRRRTATEKASQWLTVGTEDEHAAPLRALPGGLA